MRPPLVGSSTQVGWAGAPKGADGYAGFAAVFTSWRSYEPHFPAVPSQALFPSCRDELAYVGDPLRRRRRQSRRVCLGSRICLPFVGIVQTTGLCEAMPDRTAITRSRLQTFHRRHGNCSIQRPRTARTLPSAAQSESTAHSRPTPCARRPLSSPSQVLAVSPARVARGCALGSPRDSPATVTHSSLLARPRATASSRRHST